MEAQATKKTAASIAVRIPKRIVALGRLGISMAFRRPRSRSHGVLPSTRIGHELQ
jgi:hypothetical protein